MANPRKGLLLVIGNEPDIQSEEVCSHQLIMKQEEIVLDGSAWHAVSLFRTDDQGYDGMQPIGQGFGQNIIVGIQKGCCLPVLNATKVPCLR